MHFRARYRLLSVRLLDRMSRLKYFFVITLNILKILTEHIDSKSRKLNSLHFSSICSVTIRASLGVMNKTNQATQSVYWSTLKMNLPRRLHAGGIIQLVVHCRLRELRLGFSSITRQIVIFLMKHIDMKNSIEFQLQIRRICSMRIRSRKGDIFEKL